MEQYTYSFDNIISALKQNENILLSVCEVSKGLTEEELADYENGLEVTFHSELKEFYKVTGSVSVIWSINQTKFQQSIPEEDYGYLNGSIQILDPFEMIMGKTGTRWKDVLWFDNMEPTEKENISSFVPFDFPSTEIQAGFKITNKNISNEIYFLSSNDGLSSFPGKFHAYLENLINTKGYNYWQTFLDDKFSLEYQRFIKYMPLLFNDFNSNSIK